MENNQDTANTPATRGDLDKLAEQLGGKMEHLLSEQTKSTEKLLADQANVILDAVDEVVEKKMDKKLGEQFDPVITKLDAVLKQFDDHRDEDIAGAEQLRRHENQLIKLEARVGTLDSCDEDISDLFFSPCLHTSAISVKKRSRSVKMRLLPDRAGTTIHFAVGAASRSLRFSRSVNFCLPPPRINRDLRRS